MFNYLTYIFEETIHINLGSWISLGNININYGILLDPLSMVVMVPVGLVTMAVLFYAIDYMRYDPNRNRFYVILSIFAIFMTVLVISDNYVMMFIGWEFVGVISYLLISFWNTRLAAMKSALSAILLNRMGDALFVIFIGSILSLFHAVDFNTIELLTPHTNTTILNLLAIMLLVAATAKSAQLGLHSWLLLAMEGWKMALLKFHYMREYPNIIWSSFFLKNSEKSKFWLLSYGQPSGNFILDSFFYKRSSETLREIIYNYPLYGLSFLLRKYFLYNHYIFNHLWYFYKYQPLDILYFSEGAPAAKLRGYDNISPAKQGLYHPATQNNVSKNIPLDIDNFENKSKDFYNWLIGFTEGDGSFIINKYNKYLEFKITQSSEDAQILFYIKKELNIGSVSKQDKKSNTHQFRIRDKEGLFKIIQIFNGNLYLSKYQNKFKEFVIRYNETYKTNIILIDSSKNKVTLDNAWLSGFTDAEGCFSIKIYKNRGITYIKSTFILDQKNEEDLLNEISQLLYFKNLSKLRKTTDNVYRIEISCNHIERNKILLNYFNLYNLKTTKYKSYTIFKNILDIVVNNQPLSSDKIDLIRSLRKNMNKFTIENKSIGHSSKS